MRRRVVLLLVLPATLALLVGLAGCRSDPPRRPTAVTAAPTPIERLNTGSMRLARVPFCPLVPAVAVREALGGPSTSESMWHNGDRATVEPAATEDADDVVHEDGCRWSRSGVSASAWMFGRSVTADDARAMIDAAARRPGCLTSTATFGNPSQRQACRLPDRSRRVRVSGLFGTTWLSCEIAAPATTPAATVRERADAWCVRVANAVNQTR